MANCQATAVPGDPGGCALCLDLSRFEEADRMGIPDETFRYHAGTEGYSSETLRSEL
jgi:hypothetical protein